MSEAKNLSISKDIYEVEFSPAETITLAVVLCVIMVLDFAGNGMMATVVLRNKRMWTETNMFMMNLVFGDMAVSLLSMPLPLITVIRREWIFKRGPLCLLNAYCNSLFFVATIFTHTTISIDRYLACVKPMHKIITKQKAAFMITGVWILSAVISMGPLIGWGRFEYNASTLQCGVGFPKNKFETLYMLLLAIVAFVIPICVMTFAYIRIYKVVRRSTRRMSVTTFGHQSQKNIALQKKIVLTFFLALIAFIVCWAPFFAFIAIAANSATRQNIPKGLGVAAYWCGFLNSACNPFIIGLRNEQFKKAFRGIICWPFSCCGGSDEKEDGSALSNLTSSPTENPQVNSKNERRNRSIQSRLRRSKRDTVSSFVSLLNSTNKAKEIRNEVFYNSSSDSVTMTQTSGKEDLNSDPQRTRKKGRHETEVIFSGEGPSFESGL